MYQRSLGPTGHGMQIEFGIVLAVSMLISREVTNFFTELTPDQSNYVFMGVVGLIFLAWYIAIRGFVLRKKDSKKQL